MTQLSLRHSNSDSAASVGNGHAQWTRLRCCETEWGICNRSFRGFKGSLCSPAILGAHPSVPPLHFAIVLNTGGRQRPSFAKRFTPPASEPRPPAGALVSIEKERRATTKEFAWAWRSLFPYLPFGRQPAWGLRLYFWSLAIRPPRRRVKPPRSLRLLRGKH